MMKITKVSDMFMKLGGISSGYKVNVYRNGEVVTLIANGGAVRKTENGKVLTKGMITQQYESIAAFEADRDKLFNRFPLAYTKIVGRLGIDDNVRNAPPLPENLKYLLPEFQKILPEKSGIVVETKTGRLLGSGSGGFREPVTTNKESSGRPFLDD